MVAYLRKEVHRNFASKLPKEPSMVRKQAVTYKITITTGDRAGAGTDANVFLSLIGNSITNLLTTITNCIHLINDD